MVKDIKWVDEAGFTVRVVRECWAARHRWTATDGNRQRGTRARQKARRQARRLKAEILAPEVDAA